jgi:biopolymer transport protein ExbD
LGSSNRSNQNDESISEINVVPLVDIILVVLIIFMISAPMIMKPALPIELPKGKSGETIQDKSISILISQEGSIYIDGNLMTEEALTDFIKVKVAQNPEIMAMISADQNSQHGAVVKTMDLIKSLGVKKFGISIEKQN